MDNKQIKCDPIKLRKEVNIYLTKIKCDWIWHEIDYIYHRAEQETKEMRKTI